MNFSEILSFTLKSAASDPIYLFYSLLCGAAAYLFLCGLRWSINKKWRGGNPIMLGAGAIVVLLAISFFGMIGADSYIQKQKVELLNNLRDDVVWRNDALVRAWNQLDVDGAQDGLTAPDAGGTQLKLKSVAHAQIYTQQIAAVLESLLGSLPDAPPAVEYRSEEDVALQVVNDGNQIQMMEYPETVNQDNFIADAVLEIRVDELFDAKNHGVEAKAASLKQALIIFLVLVLGFCASLVMMQAWKDLVRPC